MRKAWRRMEMAPRWRRCRVENQTHAPQDRCYFFRKFKFVEEAPNTLVLPKKASATDAPKTWEQGAGCR